MPTRSFDSARIREIAGNVETILGNYDRIASEEDYRTFFAGIVAWRRANLDKGGYRDLMTYLHGRVQYTAKDLDRQMAAFYKKAKPLFDLGTVITPPTEYTYWLSQKSRWRREVMEALAGLPDVGAWLDKLHKDKKRETKPSFEVSSETNLSVDGFNMVLHEYDEENPEHRQFVEVLKNGLKLYQRGAKRYFPRMLQHKVPMAVHFGVAHSSGNYGQGEITLHRTAIKGADRLAYVVAHETGHYFGFDWMSHNARAFWIAAIKQDMAPIKLSELLAKWPPSKNFLFWLLDARDTDPVLAMQLQAIFEQHVRLPKAFEDADDWTREGLARYIDQHGDSELRILQTPITPYANANPDEAFAEAIALLVAYGPQAVHAQVRRWLEIVLPGEIKVAADRQGTVRPFTEADVEGLRKDVLTLAKNVDRVKNYQDAEKLRLAMLTWRKKFETDLENIRSELTISIRVWLTGGEAYNQHMADEEKRWFDHWDKRLRAETWDLIISLSPPIPRAEERAQAWNVSPEVGRGLALAKWEEDKKAWGDKLKRVARKAWKALTELVEWFKGRDRPVLRQVNEVHRQEIAGFQVTIEGMDENEERHIRALAEFTQALKLYRKRAGQVAPFLIRLQLPLRYSFLGNTMSAGEYHGDHILITLAKSGDPLNLVKTLAHEMGHHIYKLYLSSADKRFWDQTISGDLGDLDLRALLSELRADETILDLWDRATHTDPVLHLQLSGLLEHSSHDRLEINTRKDLEALIASGKTTLIVPKTPITGYATKNNEEAFCETIGSLVAYGPRVLDEKVVYWLRTILPSEVRLASAVWVATEYRLARQLYTPAENVAINMLVQDSEATIDELLRKIRDFGMDLYDEVTGQQVKPSDVVEALERYAPKPIHGGDTMVYHATDRATANALLKRGLIPETKPRPTIDNFEFAPGRGIDVGLYVGASPRDVNSYGPVVLEVVVPKKFLEVPTEQAQLGETDPMRALRNHDGAIINHRLPPAAFRILPDGKLAALKVAARYQAASASVFLKVAARYKEKKQVPKARGEGTTTVYVYSEGQIAKRNKDKAKRLQEFKPKVDKLRAKVKTDLNSKDEEVRLTAVVVALIDETHERVGSPASSKGDLNDDGEPHFGVSEWLKKHVTLSDGKATIRYVGKSGVDQEKEVTTPHVLSALRDAVKAAEGKESKLFESVTGEKVNSYLKEFGVSAKDLRGLSANSLCQKALKRIRSNGGKLPEDKKEREKQLKAEFKEALEEVSADLGHEASTLANQYLAPNMRTEYEATGKIIDRLDA